MTNDAIEKMFEFAATIDAIIHTAPKNINPDPEKYRELFENYSVGVNLIRYVGPLWYMGPADIMINSIEDAKSVYEDIDKYLKEKNDYKWFEVDVFCYEKGYLYEKFLDDINEMAKIIGLKTVQ